MDRQTYAPDSGSVLQNLNSKQIPLRHQPAACQQLYIGNWLAIVMNNKTVYVMAFFWPKKKDQWIVGCKLNPSHPPLAKTGLKFPYSSKWLNCKGTPPMQGISTLDPDEFDLNIFDPNNPHQIRHTGNPQQPSKHTFLSGSYKLLIKATS